MRTTHLINGGLLALLILGAALAWPGLPEEIPQHFDIRGDVTRWSPASALSWFAVPLAAVALTAVNYGLARLVGRWPHLINIPNKQQFLALPADRREPVIERIRELLYGISAPLIVLMGLIQLSIHETARGESSDLYTPLILIGSVSLTPLIVAVWLPRIQSELDRQVREERDGVGVAGSDHRD